MTMPDDRFRHGGAMWESADGGTMPGPRWRRRGSHFTSRSTPRASTAAMVAQAPVARYMLTARVSATRKDGRHVMGDQPEHDVQDTFFTELALRGTAPRQTWVGGIAFERSTLDPRDQPQFAYTFNVPGVFVQDDIDVTPWMALSASARLDFHNEFGTFLSPRVSALVRHGKWTTRASAGMGFYAPTALTEETEAQAWRG
jgi:iron complex outermembrane receptor protein